MARITDIESFIAYFRKLSICHKDIAHDELSETGDAKIGSRKFFKASAIEILQALPKEIGYPFLSIEMYDMKLISANELDIRGDYKSAFMIVDIGNQHDFRKQIEKYKNCETILRQICQRIWSDHYGRGSNQSTRPFKNLYLHNAPIEFISGIFSGNEVAARIEFGFDLQENNSIASEPQEGIFIDY